ncbi:uncharacterized protein E0L32_005873 [Thyridium curvatum]|uniref:Cytochrome P450 n=1 Tax=Thyridium curvatum TaxID=1093900 RepID=A0A507BAQ4_9PEZI|nr:uncharacterized protein E0L32_005873 [Thyridium curvatum]TPX13670.1 hypothetical protein E0L32_005873 [Thyridium curvatum]
MIEKLAQSKDTHPVAYWLLIASVGVYLLSRVLCYGMRTKDFPPGPPTIPILGNLLQFPTKDFHLGFQKLAKKFADGRITGMKMGGQNLFLVNDPAVVRDLIEKRSSNYSCRPDLYVREFGDNMNIALRDNDETWRRQRKMYHVRLNVKSADAYLPYQDFDSIQLLDDIMRSPKEWRDHLYRYTASISTGVLYGWRTPQTNTGYVKDLLEWMVLTSEAINFKIVDFYPFLRPFFRALPHWMSSTKRKLAYLQKLEDRVFMGLLDRAKESIAQGKPHPSFIRDMILDKDHDRLTDRQIAHNAAHGFGAAMFVTASSLQAVSVLANMSYYVQAMVLHPEVQRRAQEELDAVIGSGGPSPITGAVPHSAKQDDVYDGMTIPKGSIVMMNIWSLNHNRFENSRDFDPLRQSSDVTLLENSAINQDSPKRLHFTFGAGRRVCPGFHVAERNLFLAVSRILWGFNIERAYDAYGNPIEIRRDAVTPGVIIAPEPFDPERANFMKKAWRECEKDLDSEGNFKPEFIYRVFPNLQQSVKA